MALGSPTRVHQRSFAVSAPLAIRSSDIWIRGQITMSVSQFHKDFHIPHSPVRRVLSFTMFDDNQDDPSSESAADPAIKAREQADAFRTHAELAAVFEATHKFEAQINPSLDANLAKDIQRAIGKLAKSKHPDTPIILPDAAPEAARVLNLFEEHHLTTNDYHIHRRPGEVLIVRWLVADQVQTYYERIQAHFDVAMGQFRTDEKAANEWKQDEKTVAYLKALDEIDYKMANRYLRPHILKHKLFVLSTQTAAELDILYLADHVMRVAPEDIVGDANALPDEPSESDRAWFFKLFCLRGLRDGVEQMCFFTYLQKSDDSW
jgi:hypothetical protein